MMMSLRSSKPQNINNSTPWSDLSNIDGLVNSAVRDIIILQIAVGKTNKNKYL